MGDLGVLGAAIKAQEARLKSAIGLQEVLYNLVPAKYDEVKLLILRASMHRLASEASQLAAILVTAAKSRPFSIELYARLGKDLSDDEPVFRDVFKRTVWTRITHPSVQFLLTALLDNGLYTADYMLQRVRHTQTPIFPEDVIFYFLPEWSTCQSFYELQIAPNRARLLKWDKQYTAQCQDVLDGHLLASEDFTAFKEYRSAGLNHNSVAKAILNDNVQQLKAIIEAGPITLDSDLPLSLFDRFKYGKSKSVNLLEYAALTGKTVSFSYLMTAGARLPDSLGQHIAYSGAADLIRAVEDHQCPFFGADLMAIRGYHVSMLRYLEEKKQVPPTARAVLAMAHFRYKGMHFMLSMKGANIESILATDTRVAESPSSVAGDVLVNLAAHNETFMARVIMQLPGFELGKPTNRKWSTALHSAAANNAVDLLLMFLAMPGADVNLSDRSGTPLICAAQANAWEAVHALVQRDGIDVNAIANDVRLGVRGPRLWPRAKAAASRLSRFLLGHEGSTRRSRIRKFVCVLGGSFWG
jgi:hypothetical protein